MRIEKTDMLEIFAKGEILRSRRRIPIDCAPFLGGVEDDASLHADRQRRS